MNTLQKQRKRRWIGFGATSLILMAALFYVVLLRLNFDHIRFQEGSCTFSQKLHLYCPGCGGTRAVKYLLEGKILYSLLAHPIPVYAGVILLRIWTALLHNVIVGRTSKRENMKTASKGGVAQTAPKLWPVFCHWEMWFILVVVFGFFILRDVALVTLKCDFLGDLAQHW